jgi:hypothetical protein
MPASRSGRAPTASKQTTKNNRMNMQVRNRIAAVLLAIVSLAAGSAAAVTTINKQFIPATIDPNDISKLHIEIFNTALTPLTAAAFTDLLPTNVAIANPPSIAGDCGFASIVAVPGTQAVIATGGTVPAGTGTDVGTCYFDIDVVSGTSGNFDNKINRNGPTIGFVPGSTTVDTTAWKAVP